MYSTHSKGKFVVLKIYIRPLKNKIYKHVTAVSKNEYIDKLDNIVDKYNNIYHRTIKMKPGDVMSGTYIDNGVDHITKILNSKFM